MEREINNKKKKNEIQHAPILGIVTLSCWKFDQVVVIGQYIFLPIQQTHNLTSFPYLFTFPRQD